MLTVVIVVTVVNIVSVVDGVVVVIVLVLVVFKDSSPAQHSTFEPKTSSTDSWSSCQVETQRSRQLVNTTLQVGVGVVQVESCVLLVLLFVVVFVVVVFVVVLVVVFVKWKPTLSIQQKHRWSRWCSKGCSGA